MTQVTASVVLTSQTFPAATVAGPVRVSIIDADGVQTDQDVSPSGNTASAVFDTVLPGKYTLRAQRLDDKGGVLGTPIETSFTVDEPAPATVTITVPASVSAVVA